MITSVFFRKKEEIRCADPEVRNKAESFSEVLYFPLKMDPLLLREKSLDADMQKEGNDKASKQLLLCHLCFSPE